MKLSVLITPGEDGYFVARCPSLRACVSQGKSYDEALQNIKEAIELYLEPAPGAVRDGGELVEIDV